MTQTIVGIHLTLEAWNALQTRLSEAERIIRAYKASGHVETMLEYIINLLLRGPQ